jgi:hypothetical protein
MRDPDEYNTIPSREKVLNQAIDLEESISKLGKELQDVTKQVTENEHSHSHAADMYLVGGDKGKA